MVQEQGMTEQERNNKLIAATKAGNAVASQRVALGFAQLDLAKAQAVVCRLSAAENEAWDEAYSKALKELEAA
jgi:hypothetical protein